MKKSLYLISKIIVFVGFGISSLLSLIYFALNIRLLFSGDYAAYANPTAGFFNIFFRMFTYLIFIAAGVFSYIYLLRKEKQKFITLYLFLTGILFILIATYSILINLPFSLSIEGKIIFALIVSLIIGNLGNTIYLINQIREIKQEKTI